MKLFIKKILLIIFISVLFSEDTYFNATSLRFTIDTKLPSISVLTPPDGSQYYYGQSVEVKWQASDDLDLSNNSVSIFIQPDLGSYVYPIPELSGIANTESEELHFPDIDAPFAQIVIKVEDNFGNKNYGQSPGYFIIGNPNLDYAVEDISSTFSVTSSIFEIDSKKPVVEVLNPVESMSFLPGSMIAVEWSANDDNLIDNSIDIILVTDLNSDGYFLLQDIINSGQEVVQLPSTSTQYAQILIRATDTYGFTGKDLSDGYFSIGLNEEYVYQDSTVTFDIESSLFTIDSKIPTFNLINESDYFYPNGGEILTDSKTEPIFFKWDCDDDSFESGQVKVSLAYLLGGWYIDIDTFDTVSDYITPADLSLNNLIDETLWARLNFTAIDDFGNEHSKLSDDYFVLGDSEGDLDINWVDEETDEIMINWAWEAKHSIMITKNAIRDYLQAGDKITLVDTLGIASSSCEDEYGYIELKEITVNDQLAIGGPKSILKGIDHCSSQGQRRQGFVEGNPILFKITNIADASYYFVSPGVEGIAGNTTYTPGGHSVIRNIDFANPMTVESYNSENLVYKERNFDSFNVYYKTNAANLRDCTPASVGNNDANGDGQSDFNWCYDATIVGETDYLTTIPSLTQNSILTYRVWLMDNADQEVYRTVDTAMEINVELSDLYDQALSTGWNWFSLNMVANDMDINNILSTLVASQDDYIKSSSSYADYYDGYGWGGTLTTMLNTTFYKINTSQVGNVTYEGIAVDVLNTPISIASGWNWLPYLPQESMDINIALASIADDCIGDDYVKSQSSYADYYEGYGWGGTLTTLNPREGYMLDMQNTSTLTYPESSLSLSSNHSIKHDESISSISSLDFNYYDFEHTGSVTIALNLKGIIPQINDEVRAFYNGELRGVAKGMVIPVNDEVVFPLMVYSNNSHEEITFKYYNSLSEEIDLVEKIIFVPDMHLSNAIKPYFMTDEIPLTYSLSNAYPNPFNPTTTINYSIADNINKLQINVYDLQGRLVEKLYNGSQNKGEHKVIWNASSFASGLYFIQMIAGQHQFTNKVILVK